MMRSLFFFCFVLCLLAFLAPSRAMIAAGSKSRPPKAAAPAISTTLAPTSAPAVLFRRAGSGYASLNNSGKFVLPNIKEVTSPANVAIATAAREESELAPVQGSASTFTPSLGEQRAFTHGANAGSKTGRMVTATVIAQPSLTAEVAKTVSDDAHQAVKDVAIGSGALMHRLARLTAYWAGEGSDYYTRHHLSSTGIHLHGGLCAVDPRIIPYGSVVEIPGVGQFLAVDTGSAVVSRAAARAAGHTRAERGALVIDLYFDHRRDGERFTAEDPKFVSINWWTPNSTGHQAQIARNTFADEDWDRIYSKL